MYVQNFQLLHLNDFSEEVNEADKDTSLYTNLTGIQTIYIIIFNKNRFSNNDLFLYKTITDSLTQ